MATTLAPMREAAAELSADEGRVSDILGAGAERAAAVANTTLDEVRDRMGLLPKASMPSTA